MNFGTETSRLRPMASSSGLLFLPPRYADERGQTRKYTVSSCSGMWNPQDCRYPGPKSIDDRQGALALTTYRVTLSLINDSPSLYRQANFDLASVGCGRKRINRSPSHVKNFACGFGSVSGRRSMGAGAWRFGAVLHSEEPEKCASSLCLPCKGRCQTK